MSALISRAAIERNVLRVEAALLLALAGCRGGAAGRAAALPQPQDFAQWLAIAVFVLGIWWIAMKILRG